jgi:indolepyruvate ferredoxin oxidoreductase
MVLWMDRSTITFTHMGAEGANWIGIEPFTEQNHIFTNLGDGTYYHSGVLAIRAAVAAKANMTYKILFNDAVAMTGGQPVEGHLTVAKITHQVHGEGVAKTIVVTDEPEKYGADAGFAAGVTVRHRDDLDQVQREMREIEGVSVLIYDQTCAAEKRRRRKRGMFPDPPKRVFINDLVCEGCGDCSVKSNCVAVEPLETEFGRKRRINQSSCNKDFSCLKGFCPSFVTVHGGKLRHAPTDHAHGADVNELVAALPAPRLPELDHPYNILVTGIGGTGVITVGAILSMAAHIEELGVSELDMTGLAQKNGAVLSHVRIARQADQIHAVRLTSGSADLILGCDMVVAGSIEAVGKMHPSATRAVVNSHLAPTADFTLNPDADFHVDSLRGSIEDACGAANVHYVEATKLASALLGDAIATNMFMLGFAHQKGLIPLPVKAIERAIEINGAAVEMNKQALHWGRIAAFDPAKVEAIAQPAIPMSERTLPAGTLDEVVEIRSDFLTRYQDPAYARRYRELVERVAAIEAEKSRGFTGLGLAVARYGFKLMAYKDEYEVARLFAGGEFRAKLGAQFEGDYRLEFHLAPPLLAKHDPITNEPRKMSFGPWMLPLFRALAKFRWLRGTAFDPFGYSSDRRLERQLIADYFALIEKLLAQLSPENHALAVQLASLPEKIRGFGPVKLRHLAAVKVEEAKLMAALASPITMVSAAE